jgi:hypothetical protein
VKKQLWRVFPSYSSDRGFIRIHKELKSYALKERIIQSINKQMKGTDFSKEETQLANKSMKKMFSIFVVSEMQIKTTLRFHFTPVRVDMIRETTTNAGMDW